jgi:hypothetical protein
MEDSQFNFSEAITELAPSFVVAFPYIIARLKGSEFEGLIGKIGLHCKIKLSYLRISII